MRHDSPLFAAAGVAALLAIAGIATGCGSIDCTETATCTESSPDGGSANADVFEANNDVFDASVDATGPGVDAMDARGFTDVAVSEGGLDGAAETGTADGDHPDAGSDAMTDDGMGAEGEAGSSVPDAGVDAGTDSAADSGSEVGTDANPDAGTEAGVDATADATPEGGGDAGGDAESGGPCTLTSCGIQSACVVGACVPARRVFASSATYQGNLGGASGGDAKCRTLATNARLGGTWLAWISDSSTSPSTRFTPAAVDYRLLNGTLVASGWSALISGTLANAINRDETDKGLTGTTEVWTGTDFTGISAGATCVNFTSNVMGDVAVIGLTTATGQTWTFYQSQYCNVAARLYCFEQ
jgi:hypothetical protein